jgi:hypothetical protein
MSHDDVNKALEDLRVIQEMITRTRYAAMQSGGLFIWWGLLSIIASGLTYLFNSIEYFSAIGLTWILFTVLGYAGTFLYERKRMKSGVRTYLDRVIGMTWLACGVAIIIVAFIAPPLGAYRWGMIPPMVTIILAIGVFISGTLNEWRTLYFIAASWWAGGILMILYEEIALFLMAALVGGTMVILGLAAKSRMRKEGESVMPSPTGSTVS